MVSPLEAGTSLRPLSLITSIIGEVTDKKGKIFQIKAYFWLKSQDKSISKRLLIFPRFSRTCPCLVHMYAGTDTQSSASQKTDQNSDTQKLFMVLSLGQLMR